MFKKVIFTINGFVFSFFCVLCPVEEIFMGAEYDGSEYKWVATNAPATVLRALNLSQTTGNCLAISSSGIVPVSCSSQYGYICHKGNKIFRVFFHEKKKILQKELTYH